MTIELSPTQEQIVLDAVRAGLASSADEAITLGLALGMERLRERIPANPNREALQARNLVELFANSPFKGLDIEFERDRNDFGRESEL